MDSILKYYSIKVFEFSTHQVTLSSNVVTSLMWALPVSNPTFEDTHILGFFLYILYAKPCGQFWSWLSVGCCTRNCLVKLLQRRQERVFVFSTAWGLPQQSSYFFFLVTFKLYVYNNLAKI